MPDYREMYLELFRATERAIGILIDAQRACEEMYLSAEEPEILPIYPRTEGPAGPDGPEEP